jgi:hypothetical protein
MRRLIVIAFTVLLTLAVAAAALCSVFTIRQAGEDGILLLWSRQAAECDTGGGCAILSEREFQDAMSKIIGRLQRSGIIS